MRFGRTLREPAYAPWGGKYIDYAKLKSLLRKDRSEDESKLWTDDDEYRFCDEIFNTQLEKVAQFQEQSVNGLKQRIESAFDKLKELASVKPSDDNATPQKDEISISRLRALETELDEITNEIRELQRYSNINYTGFLKIAKQHDRKRGDRYKLRPMMQLSLAQRPFNSEQGYSPLLNKLSIMYFAISQQLEDGGERFPPFDLEAQGEVYHGERYTSHKFWVHPDNLIEIKTVILRHLPALVYSDKDSKELGGNDSPAITSLYLDNSEFELYSEKVDRRSEASSMRLRWYGQLSSRPEIFVEQKTVDARGGSQVLKFSIKGKYTEAFKTTVTAIQDFVQQRELSPVLRANYFRSAFQKPADDRIRIAIDTNVAFIREDTLDQGRPHRNPNEWHRLDIDDRKLSYPFEEISQSEVIRFPYALLEIKLKDDGQQKPPSWVKDPMSSRLVHPTPRFSKFVHGVASLFEDCVNNLPFWLSDLEIDIRKDPQKAFNEEEHRRAQRAEDVMAVGVLIGAKSGSYMPALSSPVTKSYLAGSMSTDSMPPSFNNRASRQALGEEEGEGS
ncbi:Phosphate metabolism transcription protein [Fusarium solani]|nr:Phosphate metabolism transcription protein [Fusarium solani]